MKTLPDVWGLIDLIGEPARGEDTAMDTILPTRSCLPRPLALLGRRQELAHVVERPSTKSTHRDQYEYFFN